MNLIDFTLNGGFRFKQFTLRKMQEAYFHILKAFIEFCNIPDIGNYIVSGCTIVGANITAGYMYIEGELCRFEQTEGTLASLIKKNVVTEELGFKNGNNEPVFRYTTAVIDEAGAPLNEFNRIFPVFDPNYTHTDFNFTETLKNKLEGIEDGAEVNVQADWNETDDTADSFIIGKPNFAVVLHKNSSFLGEFPAGSDDIRTISFPDVGTDNYMVVFSPVSGSGTYDLDNDAFFMVREKTATSFKITAREVVNVFQSITIDYLLIEL